ncbi:hypothetical protein C5167_002992 [Papaver somniferum]|uniref:Cytochrome c assembly protein domain-containing protein n=1 Tax=Papaver somniferum TaxID=3469 RepID=A0A4Y7L2Y2_PAPSO|nr:hypothetical protein C5167_002992 [Papaver somniferum]
MNSLIIRYSRGLFIAFTYNKKQTPAFGASPAFLCILLPFLGLSFCHNPNNLSNYNVLTTNAPFTYQISGTWSNHEGSILSWCWISSLYGFLLYYRGRPKSHNVSKRGGPGETIFFSFVSNFVRNSQLAKDKRMSSFLHLARDDKERVSSIDEQRNDVAVVSIALFLSHFLLASSDPFVLNFFVLTEPLAESNHVLQDHILAIHPPCIYVEDIASDMGFGLCRSKMLNGIVARHSPPMRNDAAEKNGTLLHSAGCVGSRLLKFKDVGTTISSLCWTAGAITMVSDQEHEPIRIWILTCRCFLTVGIFLGSWWSHHELGWGGWWFRDPIENASFMPRVLATACIQSVILLLLNSWTLLLNIVTLLSCVLGTSSIRSGLLASVHSFTTDDTRGLFLWCFFLLITGISIILFSHMKQQASFHRTYKKYMVMA